MPAADDRWDVVVVALRDPSHAAAMMTIAELAHYASLPPQDIEHMLEDGEVPVLENLDRAEAERAAHELAELGAVVDLRLGNNESGVFPVFKPDAERQIGVAVGGLIDDSATPPSVGESVGLPELEPDLEAPQAPRGRPSSVGRRGPRPSRLTPPPKDEPPPPPAPRPARAATPVPGRDPKDARARVATPSPSGRGPARKAPDPESLLGDIGSSAAPASPKLPDRLQRAASSALAAPNELEVDFAAAGMAPMPKRGLMIGTSPAPAPTADRSASDMPRRTRAGNMGGTGASAAGQVRREGGLVDTLREDGIAATLLGLAVGLGLGLVLAMQIQRSDARDLLPPLEEELAASLNDPEDVAAGKRRAPEAIQAELDGALDDMQRGFLLWWLLPGVGVGLLLSRLRAL